MWSQTVQHARDWLAIHSTADETLEAVDAFHEKRAPRFAETPKGRVGLVGMYSEIAGGQSRLAATYKVGVTGGRPGLNALNLTRAIGVTPEHLALLKRVKDGVFAHRTEYVNPVNTPSGDTATSIEMFRTLYKAVKTLNP